MGTHFPTEFVGKDLNGNFTGTSPTLHETEVVGNEIMEASRQAPPAWDAMKDQPEEPVYPQDETDDLILSVGQSDMDTFFDLPMDDGVTTLAAVTNIHFDNLRTNDEETLQTVVNNGTEPDPVATVPEQFTENITDIDAILEAPVPHASETYEAVDTAHDVVNKTVRTLRK